MKQFIKKYKKYAVAPLITIGIVLIIYAIKGIYPFGKMTLANGDMGQSYMTFYYFLYDVCHGTKSLFYNYSLGLGSNTYGGFMIDGFLNPTAYIILLNTRENVPYMISLVSLAKFAVIALTSYILFRKINKNHEFYNYLFSVLYALSAYSLMYNNHLMWLDVVGLFPLFILATKHMFDTGKIYWFATILALTLMFNYNLAYMVLMFIIFVLPIYIHYGIPKENRKKATFNLIIGVLLSIGLSAFAFIPSLIQVMSSYRMSGTVTNTTKNVNLLYKLGVFYFYSLPIYCLINCISDYKKSKEKNKIKMCLLALLFSAVIPIIFERVNLWWHTGSYQLFPFRYGFVPIMILYMGALTYVNGIKEPTKKEKINRKTLALTIGLFIPTIVVAILGAKHINSDNPAFYFKLGSFIYVAIIFMLSYGINILIYTVPNKKYNHILISALNLVLLLTFTYAYLGVYPENRGGREWSDEGVFYANKIHDKVDEKLYRLKDLSFSTYENSPVVSDVPSMSTFLHIISKEQVLNASQIGYSRFKTKLHDLGGTIFTDAIYGMKYVISKNEMPERLYKYIDKIEDNYLYEYKYILPYGVLYDEEITDIPEEYYAFKANNYLYQKLYNTEDNIIDIKEYQVNTGKDENNYQFLHYEIDVTGEKELYIYTKNAIMATIIVNGKAMRFPIENDQNNMAYNTSYNNGIADLGYFNNEKVTINILEYPNTEEEDSYTLEFGLLDIKKYEALFNNKHNIKVSVDKNKINVSGTVDKDTNIFLPITYDKGFEGTAEVKRVYNTFIGLPLKEGENNIELVFHPQAYTTCVYVTIATILLMIACHFIKKKFDIRNVKFIMYPFWILGILIYGAFIVKFYIISIVQTFISLFK